MFRVDIYSVQSVVQSHYAATEAFALSLAKGYFASNGVFKVLVFGPFGLIKQFI